LLENFDFARLENLVSKNKYTPIKTVDIEKLKQFLIDYIVGTNNGI